MNTSWRPRRTVRLVALALAAGLTPVAATATVPAASASSCAASWGSLVKSKPSYTGSQVTDIRSGRHRCFDRLVIDVNGAGRGRTGYQIAYVKRVRADGSGKVVPLRGGARVRVIVHAPAYDEKGVTYAPADRRELVDVTGYRTFRQVAWAVSFEGLTTFGLGVRARLPMRAFVLDGPGNGHRVVVDVAHRWY